MNDRKVLHVPMLERVGELSPAPKKDRKKQKGTSTRQKTSTRPLLEETKEGTTMETAQIESELKQTREENKTLHLQLRQAQESAWQAVEPLNDAGDAVEIVFRYALKGAGIMLGSMVIAGTISLVAWGAKKAFGLDGATPEES